MRILIDKRVECYPAMPGKYPTIRIEGRIVPDVLHDPYVPGTGPMVFQVHFADQPALTVRGYKGLLLHGKAVVTQGALQTPLTFHDAQGITVQPEVE